MKNLSIFLCVAAILMAAGITGCCSTPLCLCSEYRVVTTERPIYYSSYLPYYHYNNSGYYYYNAGNDSRRYHQSNSGTTTSTPKRVIKTKRR